MMMMFSFQRGYTPLHEAVKKGHMQIIEMLLERKADVNAVGKVKEDLHLLFHISSFYTSLRLIYSC